jgi:hypothetical protein
MRRTAIIGALVGVGLLALRGRMPKLHERVMAHCEGMFERMPDTFPPKKMMRGVEEIRATTARIEQLLDRRADEAVEPKVAEAVHDAA